MKQNYNFIFMVDEMGLPESVQYVQTIEQPQIIF